MKKLSIVILMTAFTACTVKLMTPSQADVERVSVKYPAYDLVQLNEGKSLFETTCNRCHRLKNPMSRNEEKWRKIVPKMIGKLNKKAGKLVIDDRQQESILKYIITMNGAPKAEK